jgi:NAD-dependent deacetylase
VPDDASIEGLARMLLNARSVAVLTGAGVSAESGLATFRDKEEGLWAKYDPMELATIGAFERDPELVTRWYHWRFTKARDVKPNPGHDALARLESWLAERGRELTIITQNIDGLHQRAGSRRVIEIHGTIHRWRCTKTGRERPLADLSFDRFPIPSEDGGLMRPCVVWFGEMLPEAALRDTFAALERCDVFLSIGTSGTVQPAASFVEIARGAGASTAEINKDPTPNTAAFDLALQGTSGLILPSVVARLDRLASTGGAGDT